MEYFTFFKLRESMKPHEYFTRKHIPVQTPRVQVLSGHMRLVAWRWRSSPIGWLWARGDTTRGRHVLGLTPGCRARWDTQARTRYSAHVSGLCEDAGPKAHARQAQAPRHFSRPLPHRPPSTRGQRRRAPTPPSPASSKTAALGPHRDPHPPRPAAPPRGCTRRHSHPEKEEIEAAGPGPCPGGREPRDAANPTGKAGLPTPGTPRSPPRPEPRAAPRLPLAVPQSPRPAAPPPRPAR